MSNRICYKCAYELDQCTKFVLKCRKSQKDSKSPRTEASTSYCRLCLEFVEGGHIFDITKDIHAVFSPLQKIRNIFLNENVS